jgi:2-dehydro-3-deoxygluconokinase
MDKTLCFGELLMRFSPSTEGDWLHDHAMPAFIGGAEANVATALALWGQPVGYCTALPDNYLSKQLAAYLQQKNIDTSCIHYSGERIGLYYLPQGADVKNAGVIYDRANSSFASLQPGMIDWDEVLDGISWFHFSAIAASLTQNAADVCEEALKAASAKSITISLDMNYRSKLWQYGKRPAAVIPQLAKYCDLVMGNIWAANVMLNAPLNEELIARDEKGYYLDHAGETSRFIQQQFPKVRYVANTFRFDHKKGLQYYATLSGNGKLYSSAEYDTATTLDKVGSGDCFMAGLIYGLSNAHAPQQVIDFAAAAAFNKLFIKGDTTDQTAEQVKTSIQKNG